MIAVAEQTPTPKSVLDALKQAHLLDVSRTFGIGLRSGRAKVNVASQLASWAGTSFVSSAGGAAALTTEPVAEISSRRQWMSEGVPRGSDQDSALISLVCLDDDAPSETADILWEREGDARVIEPAGLAIVPRGRLDPPGRFGARIRGRP